MRCVDAARDFGGGDAVCAGALLGSRSTRSCVSTYSMSSGVSIAAGIAFLLVPGCFPIHQVWGLPPAEQPVHRHWCDVERVTVLSVRFIISRGEYPSSRLK